MTLTPVAKDDRAAIEACVHDYFDGWFDGDAARISRALHPALAKRAILDDGGIDESPADQMISLTAQGAGRRRAPDDRSLVVHVTDVHGRIASAVVESAVYREYVHLIRFDGGWQIVNALWSTTM